MNRLACLLVLLPVFCLANCQSVAGSSRVGVSKLDIQQASAYFPPRVLSERQDVHDLVALWYSKHLRAMDEPPFFELAADASAHGYRFLWLRSFHRPVCIVFWVRSDGDGELKVKVRVPDGKGGYEPGKLVVAKSKIISRKKTQEWLTVLGQARFWELPHNKVSRVLDGAKWVLEAVNSGSYHIVDRHSPRRGAFRDAALLLMKMSDVETDPLY